MKAVSLSTPTNLRVTGPTPLPPRVLEAVAVQMISHRSEGFRACLFGVVAGLRPLFGTQVVLPFTASGTGGLEAALVNTVAPGARVFAVETGHFGRRFAEIAERFGAVVRRWCVPCGRAAEAADLRFRLRRSGSLDAVLLTHNETSTGVLSPLPELAAAIRAETDALLLVDGVSSVGAVPLAMDDWGIDVVVTATQKALMSPPGLAIIGTSHRALAASRERRLSRYYFDFTSMAEAVEHGTTTYTPAISIIYALEAALDLIAEETLPNVFSRHLRISRRCRRGFSDLGFALFADPAYASPTVTAVVVPEAWTAGALRRALAERGAIVSLGRGEWKDRVLRIGHMGYVEQHDIDLLVEAVAEVLAS